jgi:integrase
LQIVDGVVTRTEALQQRRKTDTRFQVRDLRWSSKSSASGKCWATVQAMIRAAESGDPDMDTLIALAAVTGARRGELCGLRWGDVDWTGHTLTIEWSVATMGRGQLITKDTKTHAARRLTLDTFGEDTLKRHLRVTEDRAANLGISVTPDSPIFTYDLVRPICGGGRRSGVPSRDGVMYLTVRANPHKATCRCKFCVSSLPGASPAELFPL